MFATLERVRFSVLVLPSYRDTSCLRLVWVWCGKVTGPGLPINVAALWGVSADVCTHMETNHALDGIHSAVILQSSTKYYRLQHASDLKVISLWFVVQSSSLRVYVDISSSAIDAASERLEIPRSSQHAQTEEKLFPPT